MSILHIVLKSISSITSLPEVADITLETVKMSWGTLGTTAVLVLALSPILAVGAENGHEEVVYSRVPRHDVLEAGHTSTTRAATFVKGLKPRVYGALNTRSEHNLLSGYALALRRVQETPSCRALFAVFASSGLDKISTTIYTAPITPAERRLCSGGVAAFTQVGSPVTRLCADFGGMDRRAAAMIIIHEALHHAGMPEGPSTPEALSSAEINALVKRACGL